MIIKIQRCFESKDVAIRTNPFFYFSNSRSISTSQSSSLYLRGMKYELNLVGAKDIIPGGEVFK